MRSIKNKKSSKRLIYMIIFLILIIQFLSVVTTTTASINSSYSSRQIGKSDVTIVTADVYNAGLDVPEEYENEVAMIKFSDPEPNEGENIIINATVFNVGTRGATATVYFYDGHPTKHDLIGKDNLSIHALGYSVASTPWDTSGEDEFHTIYVLINPEDPENESREDNNNATRDIIVNQIPIANAGSDLGLVEEIYEDDVVQFDGSKSTDTMSDLSTGLMYTWRFNDPYADSENPNVTSGINETTPTHIFSHQGNYLVNLTVEDDGGAIAWDTVMVKITNAAPVIELTSSNENAKEDEKIFFDARQTWDTPSDLQSLSYQWYFGDGSHTMWTSYATMEYAYPQAGEYELMLLVVDDDMVHDSATITLEISNVAPIANAGTDNTNSKSQVIFNGSGSWDTPSDLIDLNYKWDFGDGKSGYGQVVEHKYSNTGTYNVILTVTDDNGAKDMDSITIIIKNISPIVDIDTEKLQLIEDEEILFDGSGSYDPDGRIIEFHWDFSDGKTADEEKVKHSFPFSGSYKVSLTVTDNEQVISTGSVLIIVNNSKPIANAGLDLEAYVGEQILFDASNSTDTPTDLNTLSYTWDFGDNTTADGLLSYHSYLKAGAYNVTLRVMDDDFATSIHRIMVHVKNILLSSISITADIYPTTCCPGETIKITGDLEFDFIKADIIPDYTIARLRVENLESDEYWIVYPERDGDFELKFSAPKAQGIYPIKISITQFGIISEKELQLTVKETDSSKSGQYLVLDASTALIICTAGTAASVGAFTVGTDLGRFKFFSLLIPLYTRLNREALLDNFTRGRIYEHIRTNPGMHYRAIKENLELSNGSLAYHLRVLEKEDYIKSKTDGLCKRFYPAGMRVTKGDTSNIQSLILDKVYEHPYITQKELAYDLGIDISTVNYHINMMAGAGVVKAEKIGRIKHYIVEAEIVKPIS